MFKRSSLPALLLAVASIALAVVSVVPAAAQTDPTTAAGLIAATSEVLTPFPVLQFMILAVVIVGVAIVIVRSAVRARPR